LKITSTQDRLYSPSVTSSTKSLSSSSFLDIDRALFFRTNHLTNLMSHRDFLSVVKAGATNVWDNTILPSTTDPNLSCLSIWCIDVNRSASFLWSVSRALIGSFHSLSGIPSHHLKHDQSPHWWGKTLHTHDSMLDSVFESMWHCVSFDSVSHRRSSVSLSTPLSCDSLNTFTMIAYPCRCVIGSHVSPVLSYPLQRMIVIINNFHLDSGESWTDLERLGEKLWKTWLSVIIKMKLVWLSLVRVM
jgi:hypothetical protein